MEELKKNLKISENSKKNLINQAINKESGDTPEMFTCLICQTLVYDPMYCIECGNAIFCKTCITQYINGSSG